MKILCVSDTHTQNVKNLPEAEILLYAGDWSSSGRPADLLMFTELLSENKHKYQKMIICAGNHDWMAELDPLHTKEAIELTGAIYLNDTSYDYTDLEGKCWRVHASPVQPEFCNWSFNRKRGAEIRKHWDLIPSDTDILITHGPPYGIGDVVEGRIDNLGCYDLLEAVQRVKPKLHVFGHIHSGHGKYVVGDTIFVNASLLNEQYKQKYQPIVVEL